MQTFHGENKTALPMEGKEKMQNQIIEVLMKRDGLTRDQAWDQLNQVQKDLDPTVDDLEEILASEFGLELDYIFDFLMP